MAFNLWDNSSSVEDEIVIKQPSIKDSLGKLSDSAIGEVDDKKTLKSKKLSKQERINFITDRVYAILGKQKNNVLVIKTREAFDTYIDGAIACGLVSIDTETNNSLDPSTCKLMGLCLHFPGSKQAYIPVNHTTLPEEADFINWGFGEATGAKKAERLDWQLTEEDCRAGLQRLVDAKTFIVMHNGKFDYEVLKCTCGIKVKPDWDTMIGARLLNENEKASLKVLYTTKIDPTQAKYDIEQLFEDIPYAIVPPEVFALYAATDSMMTTALYYYQKPFFEAAGNERLYWVFKNIEMPIVLVTAEMELRGVKIDVDFGESLKKKYSKQLEEVDSKINVELDAISNKISAWKLSPQANEAARIYQPKKKTKASLLELQEKYPLVDEEGRRYKLGKRKVEQIQDPINLASPTQLAILFYDILGYAPPNKKAPRGTGEDELKVLAERENSELCSLLLDRRGIVKLISTYIDVIPPLAKFWPDGRIRFHLNSMGTDTGRYSSGGGTKFLDKNDKQVEMPLINIQNIPSHSPDIRLLFKADTKIEDKDTEEDGSLLLPEYSEVETVSGWKYGRDIQIGDVILTEDKTVFTVKDIQKLDDIYKLIPQEAVNE